MQKLYVVVSKQSDDQSNFIIVKIFDSEYNAKKFANDFNFDVIKQWNIDKKPYVYYDIEEHNLVTP